MDRNQGLWVEKSNQTTISDSNATPNGSGYIPTYHESRTLVICFDEFNIQNSNAVEFFNLLKQDDSSQQKVYYQAGIGTYTIPQIIATPFLAAISKKIDMAIAWSLDAHILRGYQFLMHNYVFGDRICIFGFSRGAYTARCLAGMIDKVGLLPSKHYDKIYEAYEMYTKADEVGWEQSNLFKKNYSKDVDIEFLGVWDSVNSIGLIPRRMPLASSNSVVCTFRHALALDERRSKFKANQYNVPLEEEALLGITEQLEHKYSKDRDKPTDVEEVWFSGAHCDVGGGSVRNGTKPCLAKISLRWMIRECFKMNSGIMFNTDMLTEIALDPASLYPNVLTRPPALPLAPTMHIADIPKVEKKELSCTLVTEEEADLRDSLAPIYDQLELSWFWWMLELIPLKHRYQGSGNTWKTWFWWNLGGGRHISRQGRGVKFHRSVKARMEAEYEKSGRKYEPKVKNLEMKNVTWVD